MKQIAIAIALFLGAGSLLADTDASGGQIQTSAPADPAPITIHADAGVPDCSDG